MKRAIILAGFICWVGLLAGCAGGGEDGLELQPLSIVFVAATPTAGSSPLRVTFTVNITGGLAPYFYAWDFTSDGATDRYNNSEFSRTVSVQNDYYLQASDQGGNSVYEAVLRVTDSEGTVITSDPVQITVQSESGLGFVPELTYWFTDEQLPDGSYVARSNEPVYFRAQPTGGTPPYEYQWDFDRNGTVDSIVQSPEYTFFNNSVNPRTFRPHLIVVDQAGETAAQDYIVPVLGPGAPVPSGEGFVITLNSSPEAKAGDPYPVIQLKYDGSADPPEQPVMDLAAIVQPIPGNGIPPFEYYWDFENDGAIDSQDLSPSIPFYDFERKMLINPYATTEQRKSYTLRCMVLDSGGHLEEVFRTIDVWNIGPAIGLQVDVQYGISGTSPYEPYAIVSGYDATTPVDITVTVTGSTGDYEYMFDKDGDGVADIPDDGSEWLAIPEGQSQVTLQTGDGGPIVYDGVGYFPSKITVRSLQSGIQADVFEREIPISLVRHRTLPYEGSPMPRYDHGAAGTWTTLDLGPNDRYLQSRSLVIAGGAQGETQLRSVERITETFDPPLEAGGHETRQGQFLTFQTQPPLSVEREGALMWWDPRGTGALYIHGGRNNLGGLLGFVEFVPSAATTTPWTVLSGMTPKRDMMGAIAPVDAPGTDPFFGNGAASATENLFFCGGVIKPFDSDSERVSSDLIMYRALDWPDADPMMPPNIDSYLNANVPMITPRYDGNLVYVNGVLYAIGGRISSGESVATVEAFDIASKYWINLPPMQDARSGAVAHAIRGQIYVLGGGYYPPNETELTLVPTAEVFNPNTGVWSYTVPPLGTSDNAASAAMPGPGSVSGTGTALNSIWYYGGQTAAGQELNLLEETIYFYTVLPPAAP